MNRLLLIITFLGIFTAKAQQDPALTQFWNSYSFMNPATCAIDYKHQAAVHYRNQWGGVNGAPNTILGNYNYAINRNYAVGINYMYETIGYSKINVGVLNYNYKIHFSDSITHFLSIGAGIGVGNYTFDNSSSSFQAIPENGPIKYSTTYPKLNFGIAYRFKDLFVGMGTTQMTDTFLARTNGGSTVYHPARHYYLMTAYDFKIIENFSLKPQFLVRTDITKLSVDFNLMATVYKNYSIGISYRTSDAIAFIAQVDIVGNFRLGYSYDSTINKLKGISKGTHEFVLGFQLK